MRRELIRLKNTASLARLETLAANLHYLSLTTPVMRTAAELWALARQQGRPTASNRSIDADVILAAQALSLGTSVIVATTNVGHLARFVAAAHWKNLAP